MALDYFSYVSLYVGQREKVANENSIQFPVVHIPNYLKTLLKMTQVYLKFLV